MNFKQVQAFHAVLSTGSVTRAADLLNVTQPAVSRLIAQLEHSTRLKLFERVKGRLAVTPEGRAFHEEVRVAFVGLDRLQIAARNIRNFSTGSLRIAALPVLGISFLPKVLSQFLRQHPQVTTTLQTRSSDAVRALVASGQFDFGLAADEIDPAGLLTEVFATPDALCALPAGHRLAERKVIRPKDLEGEPFVSLAIEDTARARIDKIFEELGIQRKMIVETQYAVTVCHLVRAGVGVGLVNPFCLDGLVLDGVVLRSFLPRIQFRTLLVRPAAGPPSEISNRFIAILKRQRDAELRGFAKLTA
jgi:DNA-binding transcriptional LysR family regulator